MGVVRAMRGGWLGAMRGKTVSPRRMRDALFLFSALLLPSPALCQFSPGPLSRFHASISGTTECLRCHEPRKSATADRCLACHTALRTRITAGTGFHGRMAPQERQGCGSCHAEHGGEDAALVSWPGGRRENFDHRRTGFLLAGKHAALRCDACHRPERVRAEDVRKAPALRLERTHLGLSPRCAGCHDDPHRGQFAARVEKEDCTACHSADAWKPVRFDHASARFPLAGKHAALQCARCHRSETEDGALAPAGSPGAVVRYRPLAHESCAACHTDPHQDRFGRDCARCHGPESWTRIAMAGFDHGRTRFPLVGKHRDLACARCHWSENAAGQRVAAGSPGANVHYKPIPSLACTNCHQDPHQDRLGRDCTRCHTPEGWRAVVAGQFDHGRTRYPLLGRHATLACEKCHRSRETSAPLGFDRCTRCHADAHRGQFATRPDGGACESCHDVEGFVPARFGPEDHARERFTLEGAHRAVACITCHRPGARSAASPAVETGAGPAASVSAPGASVPAALASRTSDAVFHFENRTCAACHADVHAGQFQTAGATACDRCHRLDSWHIPRFDHGSTRFPLDGAHRRAACAACHRPTTLAGRSVVRYRPLDTACRSCHAEPPQPRGK